MIGRFSKLGAYRELFQTRDLIRVALGGLLAAIGSGMDIGRQTPSFPGIILTLTSIGINGVPIILNAFNGLVRKKVNVDELVSLAIVASILTGEFLSAAIVSFVMVLGSLIEEATGESARKVIRSLIRITPKDATVIIEGEEIRKPVSDIHVGDLLRVRPGERIPVDAVIVDGTAAIDESSITGEPIPVEKTAGNDVFAGTVNQNGVLRIRAVKVGKDTTLGKVIRLVSEAEAHHPESVRLIDRYAKWFTPAILLCAGITGFITGEMDRAITVLIVGCPCALILAAPTAIVATISRAAKSGILIKGGQYAEHAAYADVILFDKTGTLTAGDPSVEEIFSSPGIEPEHVLRQAACVEQNSTHPLARAILKAALNDSLILTSPKDLLGEIGLGVRGCVDGCSIEVGSAYIGGGTGSLPSFLRTRLEGIKQRGATPLVVYQDGHVIGVIGVSDPVRRDVKETVVRLKEMGIGLIGVLSGDHNKSVKRLAELVGIEKYWGNLKPQDKMDLIRNIQASGKGKPVIFVGDGINDAPAIAAADIGIAMGAKGTEVALETADIALMHDDISKIPFLIKLGRRMVKVIKWNVVLGLTFNLVSVLAGGSGLLSPVWGAVVHNIGSVLVVLISAGIALTGEGDIGPAPRAGRISELPA